MHPRLRHVLVGLLASGLAVWIGIELAQEQYFIASVSAGVSLWAVLSWTRGPLAEAWLLAFLVFGYIIGNRGFAQITPIAGFPLFLSELGLGGVVALMVLRGALRRELPVRRTWLNGLLLLWLALGTGRIVWDARNYSLLALRDFAMVYYLLYFFATQALIEHEASRLLLRRALGVTFAVLPLTFLLAELFPDFFLSNLLVAGVPLVYYKGDLVAMFLFVGFVLLLPVRRGGPAGDAFRWLLALGSLVLGLTVLSRSGLVGLVVAVAWLARAGRWRPLLVLASVGAAGFLAVTTYSLLEQKDFRQSRAYAVFEAATSIVDFSGTGTYESTLSSDKGDNNRFRLVWWRNVAEETLSTSPLLGLGFGADLTHGFLLEYYPTADSEFLARSPHNIFMTTLGRMGLVGVAVLLAIYWVQARITARAARAARVDPATEDTMTLQAAVWIILVSACFGVVLEGPMGAIPFWIMLGLANAETRAPPTGAATITRPADTAPLPEETTAV